MDRTIENETARPGVGPWKERAKEKKRKKDSVDPTNSKATRTIIRVHRLCAGPVIPWGESDVEIIPGRQLSSVCLGKKI